MARQRPTCRVADPLTPWFPGEKERAAFARGHLGRRSAILAAREGAFRGEDLAPPFAEAVEMASSGLPFQIVANRSYDRSGDPSKLRGALRSGKTVYLPQVHQVLPRLARLMAAIRATFTGPFREECSFLFVVEGKGRPGMGLHHDGDVDSFWLQLEGVRTVTFGPPVPEGTPEDIEIPIRGIRGVVTRDLEPGTLFYMPPRAPHSVVCRGRSLAISLTFGPADPLAAVDALGAIPRTGDLATPAAFRRSLAAGARALSRTVARDARAVASAFAEGLAGFDVVPGSVDAIPRPSRDRLYTQVAAAAGPLDARGRSFPLHVAGGVTHRLGAAVRPLALELATMPTFRLGEGGEEMLALIERGIVAPEDLPRRILPEDPEALDGWRFA